MFNFDLLDKSGEVRIVAFGTTAEHFEPKVQMGSFYELSKASARAMDSGKRKWNQTGHDCEVYLDDNSAVCHTSSLCLCYPAAPPVLLRA